ncbi:MAG: Na(+)-translocating NADH-quinone reductase subunit A, partial [Deltaproteobacteria bacterium]|nr:Na(+)-translocating NADH-quinone reductase subunit A [Deltaproteobacteria bacterium]
MGPIRIKKGLRLPIAGDPEQVVRGGNRVTKVAVVGDDFVGMKPTLAVGVGDKVKLGQLLFSDKKTPGVQYTAPGAGTVVEINRGAKRHFQSIVISLEGDEEVRFPSFPADRLASLDGAAIRRQLVDSGLWTALRKRPFSRVPPPDETPRSIFVTAMDTNPLAPDPEVVIRHQEEPFRNGLTVLAHLTTGPIYLCKAKGSRISGGSERVREVEFAGPHPAGNAGTHIHFLDPAGEHRTVWHIGLQDVAAIGKLFTTGRLDPERIVSMAGPSVLKPRLVRTRLGASLAELMAGEVASGNHRVVSGSVFSGRTAAGAYGYLGRYHQQVTALPAGGERRLLGWLSPGGPLYSVKNILLPRFSRRPLAFNTSQNGSERAIFPVGSYEKVMPLDILATYLLRALAVGDIEESEALGCLELDEEDLALCTYVCPSKVDHGANLRTVLTL